MTLATLALFKAHLNLEPDDHHDDELLQHKLAVASEWIIRQCESPLPDPVPPTLIEAALMMAAHLFEQREAVSFGETGRVVPYGVNELIEAHKRRVTGHLVEDEVQA